MCGLNESVFVETANSMVKFGLLEAGYDRINLDDCWSSMERAENGSMQWNGEKFPHGLPWLTGYLKSLGFMPGIYTDAGTHSCGDTLVAMVMKSWMLKLSPAGDLNISSLMGVTRQLGLKQSTRRFMANGTGF